ncbi:Chaperonin Cpn10, conserved site [Ostreococcus tauri]|uniref:Protein groES n=1 Tax=Ostreococcus tauri TaxID=70448 RepID=A0A096P8M5_OSTTA|nr:Chaperonin Cpn10, conserved site [Ostreococcus tauri]OUS44320.1 chaperonin Cpn10 [Ostreococcus tauri]CEG00377.1 Chaperonin Cpn10, conserved site [Ostreococcus tauri]|eukprot:XP_022840348.1 Chaperonin Cpn10, conserved site [Ostreococcus tauri]
MASRLRAIRPLLDRVLVQRVKPATKTAGGILLPESSAANELKEGEVLAVGPGRRAANGELVPMEVKSGDKVMLPEYGGVSVNVGDGNEYALFREDELIGVLQGK